jgi:hypothetical protein
MSKSNTSKLNGKCGFFNQSYLIHPDESNLQKHMNTKLSEKYTIARSKYPQGGMDRMNYFLGLVKDLYTLDELEKDGICEYAENFVELEKRYNNWVLMKFDKEVAEQKNIGVDISEANNTMREELEMMTRPELQREVAVSRLRSDFAMHLLDIGHVDPFRRSARAIVAVISKYKQDTNLALQMNSGRKRPAEESVSFSQNITDSTSTSSSSEDEKIIGKKAKAIYDTSKSE